MADNTKKYKYGSYDLDVPGLILNLLSNIDGFIQYRNYKDLDDIDFRKAVKYYADGILNGTITADGFGSFTDSNGILTDENPMHRAAANYVDKIAKKYGDFIGKNQQAAASKQTKFNYLNHGLERALLTSIAPGDLQEIDVLNWAEGVGDIVGDDGKRTNINRAKYLQNVIAKHIEDINNKNYDFSDSGTTKEEYLAKLQKLHLTLEDGIQSEDLQQMLSLGMASNRYNTLFGDLKQEETPAQLVPSLEEPAADLTIDQDLVLELNAELNGENKPNPRENPEWTWQDSFQLGAAAADLINIFNPEPISSAITGFGSDLVSFVADVSQGNLGWHNLLNPIFTTVGAFTGAGDALKLGTIGQKLLKLSPKIVGYVGAAITAGSIAGEQGLAIIKSFDKLSNEGVSSMDASDWRTILQGVQLVLGLTKAVKGAARRQQLDRARTTATVEGGVSVTDKSGKRYTFTDPEDIKFIKENKTNADKIKERVKQRFNKEAEFETSRNRTTEGTGKWQKAKNFTIGRKEVKVDEQPLDYLKMATYLRRVDKKTGGSRAAKYDAKKASKLAEDLLIQEKPKTLSASTNLTSQNNQSNNTNSSGNTSGNGSTTGNASNTSNTSLNSTPNTTSNTTPNTTSKANNIRKANRAAKRYLKQLKKNGKTTFEQIKKEKHSPEGELLKQRLKKQKYYQNKTDEELDKILWLKHSWKEGGIIKAKDGIKSSKIGNIGHTADFNWYKHGFLQWRNKLIEAARNAKTDEERDAFMKGINQMQTDHAKLAKRWDRESAYLGTNEDVRKYQQAIIDRYGYINSDGINYIRNNNYYTDPKTKLGTGDSADKGWIADDYYGAQTDDRRILGRGDDFDIDQFNELNNLFNEAGMELFLDDDNYFKLRKYVKSLNAPEQREGVIPGSASADNNLLIPEYLGIPKKKNNIDYTLVLSGLDLFKSLAHNKKLLDLYNTRQATLYDPNEFNLNQYGNLRALLEGQNAGSVTLNTARNNFTSDAALSTASLLEANELALKYIQQGNAADDEMRRKTMEQAIELQKENKENRYNIAMKNRDNLNTLRDEKLSAAMARLRADYESKVAFSNEVKAKLASDRLKRDTYRDYWFENILSQDMLDNPGKYIQEGWNERAQEVWSKYRNDPNYKPVDAEEAALLQRIQGALSRERANWAAALYGVPILGGVSSIIPKYYDPKILALNAKQGSKINIKKSDSIASILLGHTKERNKMFQKDIDRLAKGVLNSIKMQRK